MKPDNATECEECFGNGYNDVWRTVSDRDGTWNEMFRERCDRCDGTGKIHHVE